MLISSCPVFVIYERYVLEAVQVRGVEVSLQHLFVTDILLYQLTAFGYDGERNVMLFLLFQYNILKIRFAIRLQGEFHDALDVLCFVMVGKYRYRKRTKEGVSRLRYRVRQTDKMVYL